MTQFRPAVKLAALALLVGVTTRVAAQPTPTPTPTDPASQKSAATGSAAEPQPSAGPAAEADAGDDLDPTKLVVFNVRLQHDELDDGNAIDLVLLRRDIAIPRPKSWRPGAKLALLRFDLPAGQARLGGQSVDGLGDLYAQALNVRAISPRLNLASGVAFQLPTATEDVLGTGKWVVAPTLIPVWRLPGQGMFFTKFQNYSSFAGDDDRRDVNFLTVNPTYIRFFPNRKFVLVDTEGITDWKRGGAISWKSGLLVGTALRHRRALWVKLEVPWGEHRRAGWTLKTSIAFRGPR
jgi:hypothetical protein